MTPPSRLPFPQRFSDRFAPELDQGRIEGGVRGVGVAHLSKEDAEDVVAVRSPAESNGYDARAR
jgi:hypothetical protein